MLRTAASWMSILAGLLLFFVGGLTVADVVNRNFRGQSILGVVEISTLLLVAIAFLGLAAAELGGKHVAVSLVEERLGRNGRLILSVIRTLLLLMLAVALLVGMFMVLESSFIRGETTNDILRLPTWPAKVVLFISFVAFFVSAVWKEINIFRALRAGEDPFEAEKQADLERASAELEESHEH
ncbi:TRAP transporter small permease subunit [Micrococcaceae sp. AOP34-BR2-30]